MRRHLVSETVHNLFIARKATPLGGRLSLIRGAKKIGQQGVLFSLMTAVLLTSALGVFLTGSTAAAAAHSGPCTSADTQNNSATYKLTTGTGNILYTPTGYYTQTTSGRGGSSQNCVAYTNSDTVTYKQVSSGSLKYTGGNSCTNTIGGGGTSDTITLATALPSKSGPVLAELQTVTGSGGKSSPCGLSSGKTINVDVTVSSGGSCSSGDTFSLVPNAATLSEYLCSGGSDTIRTYTNTGDNKTYILTTQPNNACGDGYNARITLKSVPTNSMNSVGGTLTTLTNTGKGVCSDGSSKPITVTLQTVDLSGIGSDFQQAALDYASNICDSLNMQAQGATAYNKCLSARVSDFQSAYDACKKAGKTASPDIAQCLIDTGKFTQIQSDLQSIITGTVAKNCDNTVDGIGWILCPVLNALGGLDDAMWGLVSTLLTVSPLQQSDATYKVWGAFRSLANVALIIIFLIIIFSQLTGQGVSNYGVKKTLPRLIIAAILINISYILMQFLVDVFNILGSSLYNLINGVIGAPTVPTWQSFLGAIATVAVVAGAGALTIGAIGAEAIFFLALPAALAAVIGFLAALAVLILRQALIPVLAVLAPLAFVAYLLPNTKSWFDKWRSALITMLMVYPTAALLFGGTKMAAVIINGENGSNPQWWQTLVALIVLGVPLFLLPFIARQTNPMLAKLGNQMSNRLNRAAKPINDWAGDRKKAATARTNAKSPGRFNVGGRIRRGFQNRAGVRDLRTKAYEAQHAAEFNSEVASDTARLTKGVKGDTANAYLESAGVALADKTNRDAISAQETLIRSQVAHGDTKAEAVLAEAIKSGDTVKARAAQNVLVGQGGSGLQKIANTIKEAQANGDVSEEMQASLRENITTNHGQAAKAKAMNLMQWAATGGDIADTTSSAKTWQMSASDLTAQHALGLAAAAEAGAIDPSAARTAISDPILSKNLDPGQLAALQKAAAGDQEAYNQKLINDGGKPVGPMPGSSGGSGSGGGAVPTPTPQGDAYDQRNAEAAASRSRQGPAPEVAPEWAEWRREEDRRNAQREQPRAADRGSSTDEAGYTTPDHASDDYQDRMNH